MQQLVEVVKVSSRGQVVIPERVRRMLHIRAGSKLVITQRGNMLLVRREGDAARAMESVDKREDTSWTAIGAKALEKVWGDSAEDKVWAKYL